MVIGSRSRVLTRQATFFRVEGDLTLQATVLVFSRSEFFARAGAGEEVAVAPKLIERGEVVLHPVFLAPVGRWAESCSSISLGAFATTPQTRWAGDQPARQDATCISLQVFIFMPLADWPTGTLNSRLAQLHPAGRAPSLYEKGNRSSVLPLYVVQAFFYASIFLQWY